MFNGKKFIAFHSLFRIERTHNGGREDGESKKLRKTLHLTIRRTANERARGDIDTRTYVSTVHAAQGCETGWHCTRVYVRNIRITSPVYNAVIYAINCVCICLLNRTLNATVFNARARVRVIQLPALIRRGTCNGAWERILNVFTRNSP